MVSWRLHERFRWPTNQILLLSCGVVASPGPERPTTLGIPNPFARGGGRADALLFVESRGKASQALVTGQTDHGGRPSGQSRSAVLTSPGDGLAADRRAAAASRAARREPEPQTVRTFRPKPPRPETAPIVPETRQATVASTSAGPDSTICGF